MKVTFFSVKIRIRICDITNFITTMNSLQASIFKNMNMQVDSCKCGEAYKRRAQFPRQLVPYCRGDARFPALRQHMQDIIVKVQSMLEIGSGPWVQTGGKHSFLNHPVDKTKQGQWVLSGFCLSKASIMFWITAAEGFCCPFHARPNHSSFSRSHYKKVEFPHTGLIACATHCISLTSLNNWCYESTKQSSCRKSSAQNSCSPEGLLYVS